jgi:hypothetical protein
MKHVYSILVIAVASTFATAADPPLHVMTDGRLTLTVLLPDAQNGFYRGTRFDWSGVVEKAQINGHTLFGYWKATHDPTNHDDVPGTAEEFGTATSPVAGPLGYREAKPGQTFLKIGVGELEKIDEPRYRFAQRYKIVKPGAWEIIPEKDGIAFKQEMKHPAGYGYRYFKQIKFLSGADGPGFRITRTLLNSGTKRLETDHYAHHFMTVDGDPIGPNYRIRFGFPAVVRGENRLADLAALRDASLVFQKPLENASIFAELAGAPAEQHRITVEHAPSGVSLRIVGDRPLTKCNVWSVKTTVCPEPYIELKIDPGQAASWTTTYQITAPAK